MWLQALSTFLQARDAEFKPYYEIETESVSYSQLYLKQTFMIPRYGNNIVLNTIRL
jgi:hypothetical protein